MKVLDAHVLSTSLYACWIRTLKAEDIRKLKAFQMNLAYTGKFESMIEGDC
jgi:hypothetical protein